MVVGVLAILGMAKQNSFSLQHSLDNIVCYMLQNSFSLQHSLDNIGCVVQSRGCFSLGPASGVFGLDEAESPLVLNQMRDSSQAMGLKDISMFSSRIIS
ncbi:hypothetical protein JZ751_025778 [Albula glossodonta]|uniref:Uncharacterized protein n=1 Tax=Albula glossodonta TaxID=121402 RepID=A0A8T2MPG5_9TELE|nr:hypothetical protein JZ751_025778 [Albula glossodonta]